VLGSSDDDDDDDEKEELDEVVPRPLISSGATLFLFSGGGLDTVFSGGDAIGFGT